MKRSIIIACLLLAPFITACRKTDGSSTTATVSPKEDKAGETPVAVPTDEVAERFRSAKALFLKPDIASALVELDAAHSLDPSNPQVLNLRGSCHVEMRDFGKALDDFTAAAMGLPENAAIQFNIGEVRFVTKHWDEAITAFKEAKALSAGEAGNLRDLIDFKLMLCEAALGNAGEFDRMAAANLAAKPGPLSGYTEAARHYRAGNPASAEEAIRDIATRFPDPKLRAPWEDTMKEFGYNIPTKP